MTEEPDSVRAFPATARGLLTAAVFGMLALAVVLAEFTIPIAGTGIVTDPREIFTTIGSALSGPLGGVIVGLLAGIAEPEGIAGASLLAHIAGCVWMGWAYKRLVHDRLVMPRLLVGWAAIVLVYYYVMLSVGFVVGMAWFHPDQYDASFGATASLLDAYRMLAAGATREALFTTSITTVVMLALPVKHRRPLW